ncbi:hypothetical protein A4H97_22885 [Niastella yeongjuensis]|uniref:Uncharacterized protein n=1 Tax=Niastella yeongjuensis TaxID=354355 RepID=A0A1V9F7T2_9BACT|nr:hypothetical protein [Niastella yeongjuensis]OQP54332.1 hypothetical protein A4H97_22885 [Niastella yeongjuensis]SEP30066.1 hypothetical protein SAMN05660816_05132 [Niastella yeongjuensis]
MKTDIKYYIKAGLLPTVITAVPLWVMVDQVWAGIFTPVTQVIFFFSLLLFLSQFLCIVSIVLGELIIGVDLNERMVDLLLEKGKVLLATMKRKLHTRLLAEYVVDASLKEPRKKHRMQSRIVFLKVILQESGHLLDSPELTRCALNYLGARVVISYCFTKAGKLLIELAAYKIHHQPVLIENYVVWFGVYGFGLIFSISLLKFFGSVYRRKFWELYRNSNKSTKPPGDDNSSLN